MSRIIKNFKNIKYGPAPEDNSEVLKWIKNLPKPNHNFINGEWSKSFSKKTLRSINPANNKKLYNLIKTFMESWASAIAMDLILARSEEPKIDTPEYYAILYGAIDCCGQAVGADEETTMLTASVFFHYEDNIGGIEYFRKIFDTQNKPELRKWIVESRQAVKGLIDGSKDVVQALIPLAEKYRIAVSDIEKTKKKVDQFSDLLDSLESIEDKKKLLWKIP